MRKLARALALGIAGIGLVASPVARAQAPTASPAAFPVKPVRLVVPFPPGGATDIIARLVAQKVQDAWGQSVILEYKPGGGTVIGTDFVAKSPPDGYTLGMAITAHVINPSLRPDLPYDTVKDLAGITLVAVQNILLVATPSLEASSIPELIALAKKNPGKLTYATPGTGTAMHLAGELLKSAAGINLVHVPYKGGSPAYPDVFSGRVSLQLDPISASLPNVKAGKVKAIAVTGPTRAAAAPDIPAVAETLPGFSVQSLVGIVVPSATPREVVVRISADVAKALQAPDLRARMNDLGMEPVGNTPAEFDALIRAEIEKWANVVKASGAKLD